MIINLGSAAIIEIGAGRAIPSVRYFSHRVSREDGARMIRDNPIERQVPNSKDVRLAMGSLAALQAIDAAKEQIRKECLGLDIAYN